MRLWLLAAKPDCCYKEQQQRECLVENAEAHILAVRHRRGSPRGSPAKHRAPPSGRDRNGHGCASFLEQRPHRSRKLTNTCRLRLDRHQPMLNAQKYIFVPKSSQHEYV